MSGVLMSGKIALMIASCFIVVSLSIHKLQNQLAEWAGTCMKRISGAQSKNLKPEPHGQAYVCVRYWLSADLVGCDMRHPESISLKT